MYHDSGSGQLYVVSKVTEVNTTENKFYCTQYFLRKASSPIRINKNTQCYQSYKDKIFALSKIILDDMSYEAKYLLSKIILDYSAKMSSSIIKNK